MWQDLCELDEAAWLWQYIRDKQGSKLLDFFAITIALSHTLISALPYILISALSNMLISHLHAMSNERLYVPSIRHAVCPCITLAQAPASLLSSMACQQAARQKG